MSAEEASLDRPAPNPADPHLLDRLGRPLRDLRISVIDRCNFRCSFCMPAGHNYEFLPRAELLSFEEITRVAALFARLGVRQIRLTGGEPLLRTDLEKLVAMLIGVEGIEEVALTTNGALLAAKAAALASAGLSRVTVSVHSFDPRIFARVSGVAGKINVEQVLAGVDAARAAGLNPVKVNTVVMRGVNELEVVDIARYFKERGVVVRFIEFMDVGTVNGWNPTEVVAAMDVITRLDQSLPLEPLPRRHRSDPARRFRYRDDGVEVGAIASITEPFCGDCTRARVSSEGKIYTCLFAASGWDLKARLRGGATDEELLAEVARIWRNRQDNYSEMRAAEWANARGDAAATVRLGSAPRVEMFRVGG